MTSATINIPFDFACTRRYLQTNTILGAYEEEIALSEF